MTRKPLNRSKLGNISGALDSRPAPTPPEELVEQGKDWINMNFKAERSHRQHWKVEAAKRGEDLSSVIRDCLAQRYGLPKGE